MLCYMLPRVVTEFNDDNKLFTKKCPNIIKLI